MQNLDKKKVLIKGKEGKGREGDLMVPKYHYLSLREIILL